MKAIEILGAMVAGVIGLVVMAISFVLYLAWYGLLAVIGLWVLSFLLRACGGA